MNVFMVSSVHCRANHPAQRCTLQRLKDEGSEVSETLPTRMNNEAK
jgi:hypothetical protein